jgi:ribose transport system substrate-binding protein
MNYGVGTGTWPRVAVLAAVAAIVVGACASSTAPTASPSSGGGGQATQAPDKVYKIVLSNNFVGNQWRLQMQNIVKAMVANNEPYKGHVDLKVIVAEGDPTAQIASLNDIIATKPDAILLDAGSPTALNPTIQKACAAGIVVVSFDQTITEPCSYRVDEYNDGIFEANARWLAESIKNGGGLVQDTGLPGNPRSVQSNEMLDKVWAEYPQTKVIAKYEGNYAPGPSGKALATIIAANPWPKVGAVYNFAGVDGIVQSFVQAKYSFVPMANSGDIGIRHLQQLKEYHAQGLEIQFADNPTTFGGYALQVAWRVLHGEDPVDSTWGLTKGADPKAIFLPLRLYNSNGIKPTLKYTTATPEWHSTDELMTYLDQGLSPDIQVPFSIDQSPVTKEQVFGQ